MGEPFTLTRAPCAALLAIALGLATAACSGPAEVAPQGSLPGDIPASVPPEVRPDPASAAPLPGCEPSDLTPGPLMETACQDASLPRFSGTLGGIRFAPGTAGWGEYTVPCSARATRTANFAQMTGTPLDIFAGGLPAGFVDSSSEQPVAWECDGRVITSDRLLLVAPGVTVHIVKYLRPEAWVSISAPAERISEISIGAQQVVVVAGLPGAETADARLAFAVSTNDGFVVTELIGNNATPDQLLAIASALLRSCPAPTSASTRFTVITTSRPWCARWVDQWQNETGFLLELRYLGATPDRSGGETFEYHLPPNTTENAIPEADMPGAAGTGACLARNDAEFKLYVELPAGRLEASSASLLGLCR